MDFDFGLGDVIAGLDPTALEFGANVGGAVSAGGDWGSLFGGLGDIAGSIGQGVSGLGGFAKGLLPLIQAGTGIAGGIAGLNAARDVSSAAGRQRGAQESQTGAVNQARELAGQAGSLAGQAGALAPQLAALGPQAAALAPQTISAVGAPLAQFGQGALGRAGEGVVSPASRALIDQWKAGAIQKFRDQYARMGMGESTAMTMAMNLVERQAKAMEQAALDSQTQQGLDALGRATGAYGTAGQQYGQAGQIYGQAGQLLTGASTASSGAGNVAANAGQVAGGAANSAASEQAALLALIQQVNQSIARLGAGAA